MGLLDLTPEQSAYLGDMGMGLLSASGPSRMPVSFGQALGGSMQMANQNERQRLQDKMAREEFEAQRSYRAMQERQLAAALEKQARQEAMQQQFLQQFGQMAKGTPQVTGHQFNPARDDTNTRFETGTPNAQADFMKAAQMLVAKQQAGQRLTQDEQMFLDQVRSRISQVTQNVPDARGMAQMGAAGQMLGIPGAKAAYDYAKDFEKPDVQMMDTGQGYVPVNKNGQIPNFIPKGMSPDSVAANQLGRDRLAFDQNPTLQGLISRERESGKTIGESQAKGQSGLPGIIASSENAMRLSNELLSHPGFKQAVGASSMLGVQKVPGTPGYDFMNRLAQIKGGAFLEAFNTLKGGGQITEVEGKKATDAIARMNNATSENEFKAAVRDYQQVISAGVSRARQQAGQPAQGNSQGRSITRRGTYGGRSVVEYSDGSIDYAD